ncbi:M20 family metallopeptidase [Clostridiaceae bacterium 35-E11]
MDFEQLTKEIIDIRRTLHGIPEMGLQEKLTSKFLKQKLLEWDYHVDCVAGTGLLALRKGASGKRPICFRADMDALPIVEETDLTYASNNGMMHACGHDGHMAILLGFAKYLSRIDYIKRDVLLLFQPGEENVGGAEKVMNDEKFQQYDIEAMFGLHLFPEIEQGKIGVIPGPMMAQDLLFDIIVEGKGCHGAEPHLGVDAIYAAAQLIVNYQSIISRNKNTFSPGILSIGKIEGGNVRNQVAEKVILQGTMRSFDKETYEILRKRMDAMNKGIEKMMDVKIQSYFFDYCPPVINDEGIYHQFIEIIDRDRIVHLNPIMNAEDFGFYQEKIPSLFFMLGCRREDQGYVYPLHNARFNFSEDVLIDGTKIYIDIAEKFGVL